MFRTNGVTSDSMKYSVTTPRPRCIMVECSYVFFLGPREQKRFSRVFLCFVFRFTWFNGESSLFRLPWIQRDLRQDDKWMYSIFFSNYFLLKNRRKTVILVVRGVFSTAKLVRQTLKNSTDSGELDQ